MLVPARRTDGIPTGQHARGKLKNDNPSLTDPITSMHKSPTYPHQCAPTHDHLDARLDSPSIFDRGCEVENHAGNEIGFVDQQQVRGREHLRVLDRLVLALGYREHDDSVRPAKIEGRRACEATDILDDSSPPADTGSASSAWAIM
jgi:hypothetical protein